MDAAFDALDQVELPRAALKLPCPKRSQDGDAEHSKDDEKRQRARRARRRCGLLEIVHGPN
jgi:hypothetical protein